MDEGDKKQTHVGSLKKGNYVIIDGLACTVKDVQTSRPGKHGHAKCRVEAITMMGDQKKIIVAPSHDKISVPIITKHSAQVLSINNDVVNLMDMDTYENFDLKIPDELKSQVHEGKEIVYWKILGEKVMKQVK
ncbi:translation initiation factor IF-5A [Candidatus Woesearchaeota archaeon]|nr:translation initiation factor IF-5A [Candidatus Woesearchaeota archaeon]